MNDRELCRKASAHWQFGECVPNGSADMMAVLKSGYALHESWGAKAVDTIERLTKERDDAVKGAEAMEGEVKHVNERFDRLTDYRAKAESDLRTVEQERDALKAEAAQLRGDLEKWQDWSGSLPSSWFAR